MSSQQGMTNPVLSSTLMRACGSVKQVYPVTSFAGTAGAGDANRIANNPVAALTYNVAARRRTMRLSYSPGKVWIGPLHQSPQQGMFCNFNFHNFEIERPIFEAPRHMTLHILIRCHPHVPSSEGMFPARPCFKLWEATSGI